MSNPDTPTERIEIEEAAQYIASGTRKIVDAINQLEGHESTFEEEAKALTEKSELEKSKSLSNQEQKRAAIREKFAKKWQRY